MYVCVRDRVREVLTESCVHVEEKNESDRSVYETIGFVQFLYAH